MASKLIRTQVDNINIKEAAKDVDNLKKIFDSICNDQMDRLELESIVKELVYEQDENGFWPVIVDRSMPADCRVSFLYYPTYYATCILIRAYLMNYGTEIIELRSSLIKGLRASVGRNLVGSGYESTEILLEVLKLFVSAGAIELIKLEPDLCDGFKDVFEGHFQSFREGLGNGETCSDWSRDFKEEFQAMIELYDNTKMKVFVYGTLMKGQSNSRYLDECKWVGKATIKGFRLYDTGYGFPGIKHAMTDRVKGEVYEIETTEQLQRLDRLEGNGSLYTREFVVAHGEDGKNELAMVYVYNGSIDEMNYIEENNQPWGSTTEKEYIWYACYGSNLSYQRFMRYINKCDDITPPRKWMPITIKHDMYYALQSRIWSDMAVAFINPQYDICANTLGRMYLITRDQYNCVKRNEGPNYRKELCLGYFNDIKIVTFTNSEVHPKREPSQEYLDEIKKGLLETYPSFSENDAKEYLYHRL